MKYVLFYCILSWLGTYVGYLFIMQLSGRRVIQRWWCWQSSSSCKRMSSNTDCARWHLAWECKWRVNVMRVTRRWSPAVDPRVDLVKGLHLSEYGVFVHIQARDVLNAWIDASGCLLSLGYAWWDSEEWAKRTLRQFLCFHTCIIKQCCKKN